LAAVEQWGVTEAVTHFAGMFGFALWDREEKTLTLGRDRIGEKPLYYGWVGSCLLFASELKALSAHPRWEATLNREALSLFMRYAYIPAPFTIYKNIFKLPPGTLLTVPLHGETRPQPTPYWSIDKVAAQGISQPLATTETEATEQLDTLLRKSVRRQMVADVPLGAFLSGGVDSSTITALMQSLSDRPVNTFSIGFQDTRYNEADHAKAVAHHLGTNHTELYVTPREAMDVIPQLPDIYDEPFADSSQVPTLLLCHMARKHVTVALSGDGGDELFCGYNRYVWGRSIWNRIRHVPLPARRLMAGAMTALSPEIWDRVAGGVKRFLPARYQVTHPGDRMHKLAGVLNVAGPEEMYQRLISTWQTPVVMGVTEPEFSMLDPGRLPSQADLADHMMLSDIKGYLPGDILTKVDRAAMAVSLETRIPLLDHQVVEFAWRLPMSMKIRQGQGKWLLRQVLYRYVPRELIERPKAGFGIPMDEWLRGPMRDWAETLLDPNRLAEEGFLNPTLIQKQWREHLSGHRNWQYPLWNALMFQSWLERWKPSG
jgi:asparagine synthase (glutamine-hydrolysing)